MGVEDRVAVVTDTGSSIFPEETRAQELNVQFLPLHITFYDAQGKNPIALKDTDFTVEEFYQRMAGSPKLPATSGAVYPQALELYRRLATDNDSIMSVHLTGRHSAIVDNAILASREIMGEIPGLTIEVVDSKNLSIGTWLMVEKAAELAREGADLPTIKGEVLEMVPKVHTLAVLSTLDNAVKGGRIPRLKAMAASMLHVYPIIGTVDGGLEVLQQVRTLGKARQALADKIFDRQEPVVKLAVLHTHAPDLASELKEMLAESYSGDIEIFEAGPVLAVHASERAVGVSFMTQ